MRLLWAIVAGIVLGGGLAWWMSRESPEQAREKQRRAERAVAAQARDAVPALYRWRDENGVLQITDQPPKGRHYERIDRNRPLKPKVRGD